MDGTVSEVVIVCRPLTSAAVALAVQLVDGRGDVTVTDALTLPADIRICHVARRSCRRLWEEESSTEELLPFPRLLL